MPDDYTKFVIDSYIQKRAANGLSPRLIHPTPAKIRAECEARFSAGITRKDQRTLNAFFEKDGKDQVDLNTIKRFDRDKFKPLANYLNGETADTNFKNIELLDRLAKSPVFCLHIIITQAAYTCATYLIPFSILVRPLLQIN